MTGRVKPHVWPSLLNRSPLLFTVTPNKMMDLTYLCPDVIFLIWRLSFLKACCYFLARLHERRLQWLWRDQQNVKSVTCRACSLFHERYSEGAPASRRRHPVVPTLPVPVMSALLADGSAIAMLAFLHHRNTVNHREHLRLLVLIRSLIGVIPFDCKKAEHSLCTLLHFLGSIWEKYNWFSRVPENCWNRCFCLSLCKCPSIGWPQPH